MYNGTLLAGVEAVKNANKLVRAKTAVDPCNATTLLVVELEFECFSEQRKAVWSEAGPLTQYGCLIFTESSKVNPNDYSIATPEIADCNQYNGCKSIRENAQYMVEIPNEENLGS